MRLTGLDQYIEQVRAEWENIGVAVTVVQGSEALNVKGFGVREFGQTARIDGHTRFQIGSTTKAFAAAALGMLVDEAKIGWDDPVINYLPGFQLQDPALTRRLTIRDAVAHRSGISHNVYPFLGIMDLDEAVRQLRYVAAQGAFRDSFVYSNLMYAVTAQIVEAASGCTWHEFVKCRFLQPLEMTRSGTSPLEFWDRKFVTPTYLGSAPAGQAGIDDAGDPNVAMPHGRDACGSVAVLPWQNYDNAAPAGSLVSSAADMATWMIANLNAGRFEGRQLLSKETLQELHAAQNQHVGAPPFPFEGSPMSYAMGWWRTQYRGFTCLVHSGGMIGSPAFVALLPDLKVGVTVLANSSHPDDTLFHKSIVFRAFDCLLGAPPHDWGKEFLDRARKTQHQAQEEEERLQGSRQRNSAPSRSVEQYAGLYDDATGASGHVRLQAKNGQLTLSFAGEGTYCASLEHWQHDVFRLRSSRTIDEVLGPQFVDFKLAASGEIKSMSAFGATFRH